MIWSSIFSLFTPTKPADLSMLEFDFHSHLIPGVDDGVETLEQTLTILRGLSALGIKKVVTTPHILHGAYNNTAKDLKSRAETVKAAIQSANIKIKFEVGAEYYVDEYFEALIDSNDELLTFAGNKILVECPFLTEPYNFEQVIFKLQTKGLTPILAHPERYMFLLNDIERVHQFKDLGIELQVNLSSVYGKYGKQVQQFAEQIIMADLVEYVSTDIHNPRHLRELKTGLKQKQLIKVLNTKNFSNAAISKVESIVNQ